MKTGTEIKTYAQAEKFLKGRASKKTGNNTYIVRRSESEIAVCLHYTDVVTYTKSGKVRLSSGGWRTATTKQRIKQFSGVNLWQEKGEWLANGEPFFDGIEF